MVKTNCKQLKAVLALKIRKLSLFFLASKLGEFLLFDNFFPNLANFQDLDNFSPFEFLDSDNFRPFNNFLVFDNFSYFLIDLLPSSTLILLVTNI